MNKLDILAATSYVESLIQSVEGFNKAYPYFRRIRNDKQLVKDFGVGEKNDRGSEKTRGWHVIFRRFYDVDGSRLNRGTVQRAYEFNLINYWSEYGNGSSRLEAIEHINTTGLFFSELTEPKNLDLNTFYCENFEMINIEDHVWPLVGGVIHHRSLFDLRVIRVEQKG